MGGGGHNYADQIRQMRDSVMIFGTNQWHQIRDASVLVCAVVCPSADSAISIFVGFGRQFDSVLLYILVFGICFGVCITRLYYLLMFIIFNIRYMMEVSVAIRHLKIVMTR